MNQLHSLLLARLTAVALLVTFSPDGSQILAGQQDGLLVWRGGVPGDAAISMLDRVAAVRRHAPLRSEAYQGSDRMVISAMMALRRDVLPVWQQVTARTFSDDELDRLAKGLQEAMIHDLALAAKGLVIARRGKYLDDDHVFLKTSLAKLLPDVPAEALPTMTLGIDERFRCFVGE